MGWVVQSVRMNRPQQEVCEKCGLARTSDRYSTVVAEPHSLQGLALSSHLDVVSTTLSVSFTLRGLVRRHFVTLAMKIYEKFGIVHISHQIFAVSAKVFATKGRHRDFDRLSSQPSPAFGPCGLVGNSKGQIAIFIALIFQVLFVFFAMAINIALVVHDKINLQNAVDLAAYYGAQKQAEMLNVIAHQNYQIRQSWKLLTWRYRVLGTMGLQTPPHPVSVDGPLTEIPIFSQRTPPSVCVTYQPTWQEVQGDNLCKVHEVRIPPTSYCACDSWF